MNELDKRKPVPKKFKCYRYKTNAGMNFNAFLSKKTAINLSINYTYIE
jgi:hypothetical protein